MKKLMEHTRQDDRPIAAGDPLNAGMTELSEAQMQSVAGAGCWDGPPGYQTYHIGYATSG